MCGLTRNDLNKMRRKFKNKPSISCLDEISHEVCDFKENNLIEFPSIQGEIFEVLDYVYDISQGIGKYYVELHDKTKIWKKATEITIYNDIVKTKQYLESKFINF